MDKYIKSYGSFRRHEPQKKGGIFGFFRKKKKKTSYNSGLASNPTYTSAPRPSFIRPKIKKNYRGRVIFGALGSVVVAWAVLMIYLPYFRVQKISFEGLKIIEQNEIETYLTDKYLKGGIIPHNNYFLLSETEIEKDIAAKYAIDAVDAIKMFPGVINIKIAEKITTIIYDNGYSYSLLDKEGTIIKVIDQYVPNPTSTISTSTSSTITVLPQSYTLSLTSTSTSSSASINKHKPDYIKLQLEYDGIPILYDERNVLVADKQKKVFSPQLISAIIDWQKALKDEGIGEARYFETDNPPAGFKLYLNKNWYLFIQPANPLADQINNLHTIVANKDMQPGEYIDLRFGERVFWK